MHKVDDAARFPAAHWVQEICPVRVLMLPDGHVAHGHALPPLDAYVPALHASHLLADAEEHVPCKQLVQPLLCASKEYFPAVQLEHADEPAGA